MIYTIPRRKKERGMNVSSGAIYLYRFVFSLRARDTISLSGFPGAAIRGGFGHALKNSVCLADTRAVSCAPCAFAPSCAYAAVFESPNVGPADIMKKVTHRPHPFAMAPLFGRSSVFAPGEVFEIEIALFGTGITYLPHFVHAFERLGRMGLGKGRGKYELVSVRNAHNNAAVFDGRSGLNCALASPVPLDREGQCDTIVVEFLTPCRIRRDGSDLRRVSLPAIVGNIVRRYEALCRLYGGSTFSFDRAALARAAGSARVECRSLEWESSTRYSKRRDMKMTMGGFVGTVLCVGDTSALYPVLKIGEAVQVGKNTSFGYGAIRVRDEASMKSEELPAKARAV